MATVISSKAVASWLVTPRTKHVFLGPGHQRRIYFDASKTYFSPYEIKLPCNTQEYTFFKSISVTYLLLTLSYELLWAYNLK